MGYNNPIFPFNGSIIIRKNMSNKNIDRVIASLLISSLVLFTIRKYFEIDKYFMLVKTLETFFLSLSLVLLVVFGIAKLMKNSRVKNIWMPLIGILGMFILFFLNFSIDKKVNIYNQKNIYLEEIKKKANDINISVEEKLKWNKMYAKFYYRQYGKKIKYLINGQYILYSPIDEDVAFYIKKEKLKNNNTFKYYWLIIFIFSIILGITLGIKYRIKGNNL